MTYIVLSDRIKELSYTQGTSNFALEGAATGFSSFGSVYSNGDNVFYAITDGTNYEVGSGVYITGVENQLQRFPLRSSNSNSVVNFPAGTKEVYVTYPATHAVYHGSGLANLETPQEGGMAFWVTKNIIGYDDQIIWDTGTTRLGIRTPVPGHTIDIGGYGPDSSIRASGFHVGTSGVFFPAANNGDVGYTGGRQLIHFEKNDILDPNTDAILGLSGVVNEFIYFKDQNKGFVLAGPPSGCGSECSPAAPFFRPLTIDDIPDLDSLYASDGQLAGVSGMLVFTSGVLNTGIVTVSGMLVSASGALNNKINTVDNALGIEVDTVSGMLVSASGALNNKIDSIDNSSIGVVTVSGMLVDASGALNNQIISSGTQFLSDLATASGALNADMIASGTQFLSDLAIASGALNADMIASGTQFLSDLATASGALNTDMIASGTQFLSDLATASGALNADMIASGTQFLSDLSAGSFERLTVNIPSDDYTEVKISYISDEPPNLGTHLRISNSGQASRLLMENLYLGPSDAYGPTASGNTWAFASLWDGSFRVFNYTSDYTISVTGIDETDPDSPILYLDSGRYWREIGPYDFVVPSRDYFIRESDEISSGTYIVEQSGIENGHILVLNSGLKAEASGNLPFDIQILNFGRNGITCDRFHNVGIDLDPQSVTAKLDIRGESVRIRNSGVVPNANSDGFTGEIKWDSNYIYVCVAPNTWKRASLSTWP